MWFLPRGFARRCRRDDVLLCSFGVAGSPSFVADWYLLLGGVALSWFDSLGWPSVLSLLPLWFVCCRCLVFLGLSLQIWYFGEERCRLFGAALLRRCVPCELHFGADLCLRGPFCFFGADLCFGAGSLLGLYFVDAGSLRCSSPNPFQCIETGVCIGVDPSLFRSGEILRWGLLSLLLCGVGPLLSRGCVDLRLLWFAVEDSRWLKCFWQFSCFYLATSTL